MNIAKFEINTTNLDQTVNFLVENRNFDYENHSNDMSVLAAEDFYFRNKSTQMNMVVLKNENKVIYIEVIGAAGGSSLLNFNWGSKKSFIKHVKRTLEVYANTFQLELEEVL